MKDSRWSGVPYILKERLVLYEVNLPLHQSCQRSWDRYCSKFHAEISRLHAALLLINNEKKTGIKDRYNKLKNKNIRATVFSLSIWFVKYYPDFFQERDRLKKCERQIMRWKKQLGIFTVVVVFEVTSIQKLFVILYLWSKCYAVQWSLRMCSYINGVYKVVYIISFQGEDISIFFFN